MVGADAGSGFSLRLATLVDAEAIARVHAASRAAAFRELLPPETLHAMTLEARTQRWREWLVAPRVVTLVAERDDRVLGFGTLAPSPDDDTDPNRVADMPTLYVHPDHWRRGIGRALCGAIIEMARLRGYGTLTLWTMETNEAARVFYESLGFMADGARKEDPGVVLADILAVRFRLDLRSAAPGSAGPRSALPREPDEASGA